MVRAHLKRLAAPKTWPISRKLITFISKPNPGAHAFSSGISLGTILCMLDLAKTSKEAKYMLNNCTVTVDGKRIREKNHLAGLMDVVSIQDIKKHYRVLFNKQNKIYLKEIDEKEAKFKLAKVVGKTAIKGGKMQLNLHDSKNIITKDKVSAGDTIVYEFGKGIAGKIEFKEGNLVYLTGGKHVGVYGSIVRTIETKRRRDEIIIKVGDNEIRTAKRYAFVVGEDKPRINLD